MKMDFLNLKYENTTKEKYSTQVWKNNPKKKERKLKHLTEPKVNLTRLYLLVMLLFNQNTNRKKNDSTKVEEKGFCPNFLIIFSNFHRVFSDCMLENVLTRKFRPSVLKTCLITTFKSVYLSDW